MKAITATIVGLVLVVAGVIGFTVAQHESPAPAPGSASSPLVATISSGARVDLDAHLAEAGRTVVEFTGEW